MQEALSTTEQQKLACALSARFHLNQSRHPTITWSFVESRLAAHPEKWVSLWHMEQTGGEPDVIHTAEAGEHVYFFDCSVESPKGRRSLCYDPRALEERKEAKPIGSAIGMALNMGIELLDEADYLALQRIGVFDVKTSSWLNTPISVRELGGALFGDRRFGRTFIYHNGVQSYYAARGFRGKLSV